jgi:DNA-binding Xre family transcriptional regulator
MMNWELKRILVEHKMKQKDLARAIGVSKSYISYLIRGERKADDLKHRVAKFFGKNYDDIF